MLKVLYHLILYITIAFFIHIGSKYFLVICMKSIKKYLKTASAGAAVGLVNGIFGAGGGMIAVPMLKRLGLDQKSAHANAVAVILPITVLSAALYLFKGTVTLADSFVYIPSGVIGSVFATFALKKISNRILNKIFAGFMIYAGIRLLIK